MINISSTTPAAPSGYRLVQWQKDVSGNVSGYVGLASTKTYITATGAVIIDASLGNSFWLNVTGAVTGITVTNPTDGQEITVVFAQDLTGHAVTPPTNFILGTLTITSTANKHTTMKLTYNLSDTNWYIIGQNNL